MKSYFSTEQRGLRIGLVLIGVISHAIIAEGLRFVSLPHKLPPGLELAPAVRVDSKNYVSPGLVYGACVENPFDKGHGKCTFAMETNSNVDSLEHLDFCNFGIHSWKKSNLDAVIAIDKDKAILRRINDKTGIGEISILDFSDCREIPVNVDNMEVTFINPANSGIFDVIAWSKVEKKFFRVVIDVEGNVVTGKQRDTTFDFDSMMIQSPLKWRLAVHVDYSEDIIKIEAFNYDGSTELIRQYPMDRRLWVEKEYRISATHQLLSVCTIKDFRIYGGQFDLNGVLKFELNFTLPESSGQYLYNCYNLPEGGLLLLLYKCSRDHLFQKCNNHANDYYIVEKFDKEGNKVGLLQISQFPAYNYTTPREVHFFENEKKEMCLSALDTRQHSSNNQVTLDVACFNDEDFYL